MSPSRRLGNNPCCHVAFGRNSALPKRRQRTTLAAARKRKLLSVNRLEAITPRLRPSGNSTTDVGLPVLVSVPCNLKLLPGDLVDLRLVPEPAERYRASLAAR
jgi:hypothetical protein